MVGGGLVGGRSAAGVVVEHDLHCVPLAATYSAGLNPVSINSVLVHLRMAKIVALKSWCR